MRLISTGSAPAPSGHYSQAISSDGWLFVSAQLPLGTATPSQSQDPPVAQQAEQALANIAAIIVAAGGTTGDICRLTAYITDITRWGEVNAACEKFFGDHRPTRAVVPTGRLHFGYSVAFDAVARLGSTTTLPATADLCDEHRDVVHVLAPGLESYGGKKAFAGLIDTVQVREDNSLVRQVLSEPGNGRVLIVDGGALPVALVGDNLAGIGVASGWNAVVVNGYIRDTAALKDLPLGVLAIGAVPLRSFTQFKGARGIKVKAFGVTFQPGSWLCADADGAVVAAEPLA
ncbi:MAG: ribonuclease E activity regulator RraA [Mycobacteriales bacterium]